MEEAFTRVDNFPLPPHRLINLKSRTHDVFVLALTIADNNQPRNKLPFNRAQKLLRESIIFLHRHHRCDVNEI